MDIQWLQWLVAAGTTAFVAGVGFVQWRTAQQKAVLDLFDRRFAIYEVVRRSVEKLHSEPDKFVLQQYTEFDDAVERAYFFFGDDVITHLRDLSFDVRSIVRHHQSQDNPSTRFPPDLYFIDQFDTVGRRAFGRYMRFSQTVPIGLWATICRNIRLMPQRINLAWREWVMGRSYSGRLLRRSWRKSRTSIRAYSRRKRPNSNTD